MKVMPVTANPVEFEKRIPNVGEVFETIQGEIFIRIPMPQGGSSNKTLYAGMSLSNGAYRIMFQGPRNILRPVDGEVKFERIVRE